MSNAQGQLVYTTVITNAADQTVDMSRWPSGVYLFAVFQGGEVSTVKVVKE
ncbi:MAG: T9SS type A sorting domain-containing protein [Lewinellaceae bacterium]|nr:T9SS type A sorting domain-containing protein [Lewinellaceae bacterium]